ncbi:hypothetical protein LOTGIDRAFT_203934 [Lottia gigantea]|uniref:Phosphatidylcholine transfer protein n=1 Tax=Lottia gigantea TaxID=225164 RepID=V4ABG2_LOTGI|nr:hypothetical protein LOTGIDRAFT_203934 [Lottia gigantea]ESO94152.1 hypothetical protein LOTGIDRAFT_203934 [Lottia gigantea]
MVSVFPATPLGFSALEFENAVKELENPQTEGFEFFTESHDVKIYKLYNEESGLYVYKIYGILKDVLPETCADVYMDLKYRKTWDTYAKELEEIEDGEKKLIYWNVNYPFPMWNRDYVYQRELRELESHGSKVWVVLSESDSSSKIPEKSGVIRVSDFKQSAALMTDGKNGTKAFMQYYDDPKGAIPTWLINWVAKKGVPEFLTMMEKACKGYPEYLK